MRATADFVDDHPDAAVCALAFRSFGGRRTFEGAIATVRCHEDNVVVKRRVAEPGEGRVLVVDGGGSVRVALLGDRVAALAASNGWAGVVVHGAVRDVAALGAIDVGIVALGTCPRASAKLGAGETDEPVTFGGVEFRPGAHIVVDDDGIVVLDTAR